MFLVWPTLSLVECYFTMRDLQTHKINKDYLRGLLYILIPYLQAFQILMWRKNYGGNIQSFLQNFSPLPTISTFVLVPDANMRLTLMSQ